MKVICGQCGSKVEQKKIDERAIKEMKSFGLCCMGTACILLAIAVILWSVQNMNVLVKMFGG